MSLVTIDDRITRLHEHSVSIEVVERVDRTCFYTTGCSIPLDHADENVLWIRGQHLLDSDAVKAARSAVALGEKGYGGGTVGIAEPPDAPSMAGVRGAAFGSGFFDPQPAPLAPWPGVPNGNHTL